MGTYEKSFVVDGEEYELYRQWNDLGDGLLEIQGSHLLGEALERRTGRVDCHVLQRQYSHLSPLVGSV